MSIRFKVILPYLLLTLLVAVTGVYVVTNLVTNTLSERLTNQLLEAGRVVSDDMARLEISHVDAARIVAYTRGIAEAVAAGDKDALRALAMPTASGLNVSNLFIFDAQGQEILHYIQRPDGGLAEFASQPSVDFDAFVQDLLAKQDAESPPQRIITVDPVDGRYYYYTAIPILLNTRNIGAVLLGTPLDTILPDLKSTSLANIILYNDAGDVIGTTFGARSADPFFISGLNISPEIYRKVQQTEELVNGENLLVDGRWYRLARGTLRVADSELGIFAVALPLEFVLETGTISRNTYVALFTLAMLVVILVGYAISRIIIRPLSSLVDTSQAITAGDLTRRSGIRSADEIGTLANSFDKMTDRLQGYTAELEKKNKMLGQMDETKASFIQVSAHELRTPLTLIKGYAQMLQQKASEDLELESLSQGILDGYERMAAIVNNMLDVSKIDSQTLKISLGSVQMGLLVMQLQKDFQTAFKERNITLITKGLERLPLLKADPGLLKKAFYHLIINAIKYTPDGGEIIVSGRVLANNPHPTELEIIVEDTGIGIAAEHQDLIFEKFYQTGEVLLHSSGKTNYKGGGPGLGLAIAKGIIEAHHGTIWVESPGCDEENCPGSKFYVRLPLEWQAP
ncbi:MAG: ATP-binding protein [Anaerolineales bacterium]|nr:ATP-binding protein [Anaerolineales bacterium]